MLFQSKRDLLGRVETSRGSVAFDLVVSQRPLAVFPLRVARKLVRYGDSNGARRGSRDF